MTEALDCAKLEIAQLKAHCSALQEAQAASRRVVSATMSLETICQLASLATELQATLSLIFFIITDNFNPDILQEMGDDFAQSPPLTPIPFELYEQIYRQASIYSDDWNVFRKSHLSYIQQFRFDYFMVSEHIHPNTPPNQMLRTSFQYFLKDFSLNHDKIWLTVKQLLVKQLNTYETLTTNPIFVIDTDETIVNGAQQDPNRAIHVIQELIFRGVQQNQFHPTAAPYYKLPLSGFELPWLNRLLDVLKPICSFCAHCLVPMYIFSK